MFNLKCYVVQCFAVGILSLMLALSMGCSHTGDKHAEEQPTTSTQPRDPLDAVRALHEAGRYDEALRLCLERYPEEDVNDDLEDLRNQIIAAILTQREKRLTHRKRQMQEHLFLESDEKGLIPDTYGRIRTAPVMTNEPIHPGSPMLDLLRKSVSVHLKGANVYTFIQAISRNNINIIADHGLADKKAIDIEADNVPLGELFDFISRNYNIQFHLGENIIWVTEADPKTIAPLQTRIYRLEKGLQHHGTDWSAPTKKNEPRDITDLTHRATVLPDNLNYLEEILTKFVPAPAGAQMHLDANTHTLFVRNTRENLVIVDRIVRALDVNPPQVLIEARFVELTVADLREIGIEWMLDSPYPVTTRSVYQDGMKIDKPETLIVPPVIDGQKASAINYTPYRSNADGTFPLGPQGSFGIYRPGPNPPTYNQGLNLTYQGLLTEPMFRAVLHALEISGKGRTLSVPRVTTINNNPAKLRNGEDLLYFDEFQAQAFSLVDADNRKYTVTALIPRGKPQLAELGITLVAVPSVGLDRRSISLLLTPTISKLEGFTSYQDDATAVTNLTDSIRQVVVKLPVISRREVQTKVLVESGETVVMGGLIDSVSMQTEHKVPFLGSLPLIGHLFKRTDVTSQKKNLIIFVTATVLSERGENLRTLDMRDPMRTTVPPGAAAAEDNGSE